MSVPRRQSEAPRPTAAPPGLGTALQTVIGARSARLLHRAFGFETVRDLLTHYPRRYASRGELSPLATLPVGETVTIVAEVRDVRERRMRGRHGSLLEVRLSDGSGTIALTFFNQSWRAKELLPGVRGMFAGKVTLYRGSPQLTHPDYELFVSASPDTGDTTAREWAAAPIPVYPAVSSASSWQIQRAIGVVLDALGPVDDPVPEAIREKHGMLSHRDALEAVHRPRTDGDWRMAQSTLRRTEALVLQTALLQQRALADAAPAERLLPRPGGFLERFDAALPFPLTPDQHSVGEEIAGDLARPHPMSRLLQGDVGSGKTLVALRAMLAAADAGAQCALMAPTEVLASQHLRTLTRALGPQLASELVPTLLTGSLGTAARRSALLRIASGRARLVIGTHALFQDAVTFENLALVVIDEQHRFGVEQRAVLQSKGSTTPHTLVMTATPIPRTIAMTVFGDLDVSTLRTMPPGRQPVATIAVPLAEHPGWEDRIWTRSAEEIAAGRQVFVVCPAIDERQDDIEGEDTAVPAAPETEDADAAPLDLEEGGATTARTSVAWAAQTARAHPALRDARVGTLHGRMRPEEKDGVMQDFTAGRLDMLIATTVVEVGVDVPRASLMVVFDADVFGLSQLHQLRGRVGRGELPGLCLLVTRAAADTPGRIRVDAAAATSDGFELAEIDLTLRREGDVLGATQSGSRSSLRLLRVTRDAAVIADARREAQEILAAPGGLAAHPALVAAVRDRLDDVERDFLART